MATGTDIVLGTAVICTALDVEYRAVRDHLDGPLVEREERGTLYEIGTFPTTRGRWTVALAQTGAGNTQAGIELERAISVFHPQCVLFVGVAGGRKLVSLGDVVIADYIYDYESGKDTATDYLPRIKTAAPSHRLLQRAKQLARDAAWQHRIRPAAPETTPKAIIKPIAAGGKVIADENSSTAQFLRRHCEDAAAVEMEGHGFLHGAYVNDAVDALVVRGISDLMSGKTEAADEYWQPVACQHAAAFAFELLARSTAPPVAKEAEGRPSRRHNSNVPTTGPVSRRLSVLCGERRTVRSIIASVLVLVAIAAGLVADRLTRQSPVDSYATVTSARPIVDDNLRDNRADNYWREGPGAFGDCKFAEGAYHARPRNAQGVYHVCCRSNIRRDDFAVQVEVRIQDGDEGGLAVRWNNSIGYFFHVTSTGRYRFFATDRTGKDNINISESSTPHPAIKSGVNQVNVLAVLAQGPIIYLFVNGQHLETIGDSTYPEGGIALCARNFSSATDVSTTDVAFNNLKVWRA